MSLPASRRVEPARIPRPSRAPARRQVLARSGVRLGRAKTNEASLSRSDLMFESATARVSGVPFRGRFAQGLRAFLGLAERELALTPRCSRRERIRGIGP